MKALRSVCVTAVLAVAVSAGAGPITFSINYSDSYGDTGSGTVIATDIGNGEYLASSGSFSITAGPYSGFVGSLAPITGHGLWNGNGQYGPFVGGYEYTAYGGTDLAFDDLIGKVGGTYQLSVWGMIFNDPTYSRPGGQGLVFDPSTSGGSGYQIDFGGQAYGLFNGYNNEPWADSPPATITVTYVPDGGATSLLLVLGLGGLGLATTYSRKPAIV